MSLVVIFGPPAVGKMAVGLELARLSGLKLFHNHMAIELALAVFPYGDPAFTRLVRDVRRRVFEEVAASDGPGLIYTFARDFDDPEDARAVDAVCDIFRAQGRPVFQVELAASQEERLRRNTSPLRLAHKPSKRDLAASEARLRRADLACRFNTAGELDGDPNYLRLDNTQLSPADVAAAVTGRFGLGAERR